MPQMVMGRNYILRTTAGHIVGFRKGEPVFVHPHVVDAAMAAGADFVEVAEKEKRQVEEAAAPTPLSGDEREKRIFAAFHKMVTENSRDDFNGAGYPNMKPLREICGFAIDAAERNVMWEKYKQQDTVEE